MRMIKSFSYRYSFFYKNSTGHYRKDRQEQVFSRCHKVKKKSEQSIFNSPDFIFSRRQHAPNPSPYAPISKIYAAKSGHYAIILLTLTRFYLKSDTKTLSTHEQKSNNDCYFRSHDHGSGFGSTTHAQ